MPQVSMWAQYAALPINLSVEPKTLTEIREYRNHLNAKQIRAVRQEGPALSEFEQNRIGFWLKHLADLEDKMLANAGMGHAHL